MWATSTASLASFEDATAEVGLPDLDVSRVVAVDLNGDRRADLVARPNGRGNHHARVFIFTPVGGGKGEFVEVETSNLPELNTRDVLTFADLNNDGRQDAIVGRYLDYLLPDFTPPATPTRTAWLPGNGDGTFGEPIEIPAAPPATTAAIAVGDVNADGLLDLWLGNWYERYGKGLRGFTNDLLLQYPESGGDVAFTRWAIPDETTPVDADRDNGGRPTYGTSIARLDDGPLPYLLEMNYGRRWNRLYALEPYAPHPGLTGWAANGFPAPPERTAASPDYQAAELRRTLFGSDIAPATGFDGDKIRHGIHPVWLHERGEDDARFKRGDEAPYRANGNTFDAAIGDIDNDGDFDVFLSTIIHNWAGDSSDRSRFLVNRLRETGHVTFDTPKHLNVDRVPDVVTPENRNFNQGDIFCELADLNNDGRLDLILCSSDYSDPPPHDERLRIYLQQEDGSFADKTTELGIDHQGAGQPTLLDFDRDGDLDLIVGQSFNRLSAERRREAGLANGSLTEDSPEDAKATPRLRLYRNTLADDSEGVVLRLVGNPSHGVSQDAYGAILKAAVDHDDSSVTPDVWLHRQLIGPGGHAGKRSDSVVHFGLGKASEIKTLEIIWPNAERTKAEITNMRAGSHTIIMGD